MIEVEIQVPEEDSVGYRVGATLRVEDDGTWQVFGDSGLVDLDLRVVDDGEFVTFSDDPIRWTRHLRTALRTGRFVPVIVQDTGTESDGHP